MALALVGIRGAARYWCPTCEVAGCGDRCWNCGTPEVSRIKTAVFMAAPGHADPPAAS